MTRHSLSHDHNNSSYSNSSNNNSNSNNNNNNNNSRRRRYRHRPWTTFCNPSFDAAGPGDQKTHSLSCLTNTKTCAFIPT